MDGEAYEIMIISNNSFSMDSKNRTGYKIKSKVKTIEKKSKNAKDVSNCLKREVRNM